MTDLPTLPSTEAVGEVRRRVEQVLGDLDVDAIAEKWLRQCGSCDAGMPEYGCSHAAEDYRPTMLRLVGEVRRLRTLVGAVQLFGTGYQWRRSDGEVFVLHPAEVFVLHPAEVDVFVAADHVAESERLRSELEATIQERDAARAELLAKADAAAVADDDLHHCEVCEVATELAEERTLHQQTIAERDRWKSRASKEHVQKLTLERDEARAEAEQLRYERRLLGFARRTLDLVVAGPQVSDDWDRARREAADIAQRIVDEIGHPATDEDALGPSFRRQIDAIRPVVEAAKAWREIDRYGGLSSNRTLANAVDVYTNREAGQ